MAEAQPDAPDPLELAVEHAIATCVGDVRAALKAALVANAFLESEVERLTNLVSVGFARGKVTPGRKAAEKVEVWRELSSPSPSSSEGTLKNRPTKSGGTTKA